MLSDALAVANTANLVGEDELKWKTATGIRVSRVLLRHRASALTRENGHGLARLRGRYDTRASTPPNASGPRSHCSCSLPSITLTGLDGH